MAEEERESTVKKIFGKSKRAADVVAAAPDVILERLIGGGKGVAHFIKRVLRWFLVAIMVLLVAGGFIIAAVIPAKCAVQDGLCPALYQAASHGFKQTQIGEVTESGIVAAWDLLWNPDKFIKPGGPFSFEDEQKEVIEYGVRITRLRSDDKFYETGRPRPIRAIATVNVKAPENNDIKVDFTDACKMDKYEGQVDVTNAPFTDGKSVRTLAATEDDYEVACVFLDGVKSIDRSVEYRTITFKPSYEIQQDVTWFVYAKNQRSPRDDRIGVTKSTTEGPMILGLYSYDSQPFYQGVPHQVYVGLENNKLVWKGRLDKINYIRLKLPPDANLISTDQFCRFEPEQEGESGSSFILAQEEIEKANVNCDEGNFLLLKRLSFDECLKNYKDKVEYSCSFEFSNAEEVLTQERFAAEVGYRYIAENSILVTITKTEA